MTYSSIRKAVRALCGLPLLGRPARIAAALLQLPDWRDHSEHARQELGRQLAQQVAALQQALAELERRQHALESAAVPALQHALAQTRQAFDQQHQALQQQLLTQAPPEGLDNLLMSAPVSLRKLGFDQHGAQQRLDRIDAAMASASVTADYLLGRVEFVRRELMYEMRYGAGSVAAASAAAPAAAPAGAALPPSVAPASATLAQAQVLAPARLAAARAQGIRLNLGCGHLPLPDYINVDRRALPGVDLVAEADALPFGPDEVAEISSAHLLEHFPQEQLRRQLLPAYFAMLRPGGRFHAVVPDARAMMAAHAEGHYPYEHLREVMFGAQDYDGDFHFNMFTPDSLAALLRQAGFVEVRVLQQGRRNGNCYEFAISAAKPGAH